MFKRVLGTKDILPEEAFQWQNIEKISREIFALYNYKEIRPPVMEEAGLFDRSLGESTEIVQKQMFLIKKENDTLALRPEGTAPVVRAFIENNLDKTSGFIKFYYIGPMFRAERPQKGRLRQFHHLGCEVLGSYDSGIDIEIISLADNLLKAFSVEGYEIQINSLGCMKDKKELTQILRSELKGKIGKLCPDCNNRFKGNILRVLDCKNEACQDIIKTIDIKDRHLCPECKRHFLQVREGLDSLNINYRINHYLVRGLDYYTRTVFEVRHKGLGSQDALGAGGRYDKLVEELGGQDTGAMGFAFGIERLLLVSSMEYRVLSENLIYIVTLGEEAKKEGMKILDSLRQAGIASDTDYENKSLKGAMRKANDLAAKYVLIIGEDELKKNVVMLKDMESGAQEAIGINNITEVLRKGFFKTRSYNS